MHISFVISSLRMGGAERAAALLCNQWSRAGHHVHILTFEDEGSSSFYTLDPGVTLTNLGILRKSHNILHSISNILWRNSVIRQALKHSSPDVVVSFMDTTNIRTLAATVGLDLPVIVSERTDPSKHNIGRVWRFLRAITYPFASVVVTQTRGALLALPWPIRSNGTVIGNAVQAPDMAKVDLQQSLERPTIISVGRLSSGKGYFTLIEAFASIAEQYPQWHLTLVGDGDARAALEARSMNLGLMDRIHFLGASTDISPLLYAGDIFALASRYEGFPNALCEALAHGLPVVATDTLGAREVIRHEYNGLLTPVGDAPALGNALARLIENGALRQRLRSHGPEILLTHSVEQISAQWLNLLRQRVHD